LQFYQQDYKFCLKSDDSGGYCCKKDEVVSECTSTTLCSPAIPAVVDTEFETRYYAFLPGLSTDFTNDCGASSTIEVSDSLTSKTLTIPLNSGYTCYYNLKVPELTYRSSSVIELYMEVIQSTYPRVYVGNGRSNLTESVEGNVEVTVGAPIEVPVDDEIMLMVKPEQAGGTLQISYKVRGEKYPWWEYIFLGQTQIIYYVGLSGLCIVFVLCICLPCTTLILGSALTPATTLTSLLSSILVCICCCACCRRPK
jgi:hypothetical protein